MILGGALERIDPAGHDLCIFDPFTPYISFSVINPETGLSETSRVLDLVRVTRKVSTSGPHDLHMANLLGGVDSLCRLYTITEHPARSTNIAVGIPMSVTAG
jgi:hypothetical protein